MTPTPFPAGLTHLGLNTWSGGKCDAKLGVLGFDPDPAIYGLGPHPVFVYFHATYGGAGPDRAAWCRAAAERGMVAISPLYQSALSALSPAAIDQHAKCMMDPAAPQSALSVALKRPGADPSRVVVAGFSQGSGIAGRAANHNPAVKAAWLVSYYSGAQLPMSQPPERGGTRALPDTAIRVTTSNADVKDQFAPLVSACGNPVPDSPNPYVRLREDGSGFIVVRNEDVEDKATDHCFFYVGGCYGPQTFDKGFMAGDAVWSLDVCMDWLASRVAAA